MELDQLKLAWRDLEQRLDTAGQLGRQLYREDRTDRIRSTLRRLVAGQAVQIAIWVAVMTIVAPFWLQHRSVPHLLAFGLVLHAYAIVTVVSSALQICVIAAIDYSSPVLVLQRRLAQLRTLRIWSTLLLGLPWWLLWTVGFVVGVKHWMGLDLYATAPGFVWGSLGFGVVALGASVWIARRIARRARETGRPARFADDLAGHSLRRAIARLGDLARFERS